MSSTRGLNAWPPPQVLEYATYLGMEPEEDEELLWIAEQALRAPVPEGWEEMMDPFGDIYFYNDTTSQVRCRRARHVTAT